MVILTIVDRFSKAAHFVALPKFLSALETASLLVDQVFWIHGTPADIVSDRGPQFPSLVWKAFAKALGVSVSLSSGYYPQSNGQAGKTNQDLESALRCVAAVNPSTWSQHLSWEDAHNAFTFSATGVSPFEASLGYQPPLLSLQEQESAVPSIQDFIQRASETWKVTRSALEQTQDMNRHSVNHHHHQPGQLVWFFETSHWQPSPTRSPPPPHFIGPFPVNDVINPSAVQLTLPKAMSIHPTFHMSQLKHVSISSLSPPSECPPHP